MKRKPLKLRTRHLPQKVESNRKKQVSKDKDIKERIKEIDERDPAIYRLKVKKIIEE